MPYKEAPKPVPVIARELQVDASSKGGLRAGGKIQITTTIIRGVTGAVIWAQKFERDANDVLSCTGKWWEPLPARWTSL